MANYCYYLIRAKGTKKAALMAYASTPKSGDDNCIVAEFGTEDKYVVWYYGECKWDLDAYCKEKHSVEMDLTNLSEEDLRAGEGYDYWDLTMRQRSEVLGVDLFAHSWSEESNLDYYEHWKAGTQINHGNWKCNGSSMIESDFAALKEKEHINFNDDIGNIWDVHIPYTKDRIKAYNSKQKAGRFSASFYNPVIISILQKYKYKPFFNNINSQEVILSGKKYRNMQECKLLMNLLQH